jgi:uncharacterized protein (UPF0261 family)
MRAYVVGTFHTKGDELAWVRDLIAAAGLPTEWAEAALGCAPT